VAEVLRSEAVLISSKSCKHPEIVNLIKKRIQGYLTATSYMMIQYNVSRKLLPQAVAITPGKRAPTISALDDPEGESVVCVAPLIDPSSFLPHRSFVFVS
jgi:ATP phosphoribosyltransferase